MTIPILNITLHQGRNATDSLRDTEDFDLVSYADNSLHLGKPGKYAHHLAHIVVDRPYIYAGSVEEWRNEVARHAIRQALDTHMPGVHYSDDCGEWGYYPE